MLQGFKEFIMKGNIVDLAVAVIVGGAFGKVIDALVSHVLMPLIAMLFRTPNFDDFLVFGSVQLGVLLTAIVNFLIVAGALYFVVIMPMNAMMERRNRKLGLKPNEEEIDPHIALLTEIRDSLRTR